MIKSQKRPEQEKQTYWVRFTRPSGGYVQTHVEALDENDAKRRLKVLYGEFELHSIQKV